MEMQERIEREKELLEEMKMVRKLTISVVILTLLLMGSNAFWLFMMYH